MASTQNRTSRTAGGRNGSGDGERDEDGVLLPRLRFWEVACRGALYGLAANALAALGMAFVTDHNDREEYLAVVSGLGLIAGGALLVIGLFFWGCCLGDIRRWRDLRTITGQTDAVTIMAPSLIRVGVLGLVLFPGPYGLYHLVDAAPFGSRLYGN
ncbi:DUF6336 family protein [Streptomyces sp. NPDC048604]|uniref:DUF6336 family protein n=1 Tax=Streptomyces sp. NPDC048604 TaxID=3365578 RepID=UPI00371D903F